jgi:glycosyltransferase involved in cell wall biosynthesis
MRIVIDMQGAQVESQFRGADGDATSLAQAILRNRGEHEIVLVLSGLLADTIEPIRAAFRDSLPPQNVRIWYAPGPTRDCQLGNEWRRKVAERIRESFLSSLQPDLVFIPSFFEGYDNCCVTSVALFAQNLITAVVIDRLTVEDRGGSASQERHIFALRKRECLKRADLLLVSHPLSREEAIRSLGVPEKRVVTAPKLPTNGMDRQAADVEARKLLDTLVGIRNSKASPPISLQTITRPKMAYLSPLPPERSGISNYSAELLPELGRFYNIDIVSDRAEITTPWIKANCRVRTVDWFLQNFRRYDRVIYHFGNSPYHEHMFALLDQVPGVVVLHDFYLADAYNYLESRDRDSHALTRALYVSHGYWAIAERFRARNEAQVLSGYPTNLEVLRLAQGVIVHSAHSRQLAQLWYGDRFAADWSIIPLARSSWPEGGRAEAREKLGLGRDHFIVCSFGYLGEAKLNHRLLEAWLRSQLAVDNRCLLVFVGESDDEVYGAKLIQTIYASGVADRIRITGWTDVVAFRDYLDAADVAVQLRTLSRGETSAAVLDCMNHGLPTIVNANGSMADLMPDSVWMLPDDFEDDQLVEALETLWQDGQRRLKLGTRAREVIVKHHAPRACAQQYFEAIETFHVAAEAGTHALVRAITELEDDHPTEAERLTLARTLAHTFVGLASTQQLLVDVSITCRNDIKTGIQRVVRALVWELLQSQAHRHRVEPVYLTREGERFHYRYARKWTSEALGIPASWSRDEPVECSPGDVLLCVDLAGRLVVEAEKGGVFNQLKRDGVDLHFVVYDLLPILMPDLFPPGEFDFQPWLSSVTQVADSAICISRTVADELHAWVAATRPQRLRPLRIEWFQLGSDFENSIPTHGIPENAEKILSQLGSVPSFLMVGTIEPRKGYLQVLAAFTRLWEANLDINLVIVGKEGWIGLPDGSRRTIPQIVDALANHPRLGRQLLWLQDASDEFLERIYAASACLIAASEGEGFGLPLIEAARHKLPIIARDIPVFREVAGDHALYFTGKAEAIGETVRRWLELNKAGRAPSSRDIPLLSWKQSAELLISRVFSINQKGAANKKVVAGPGTCRGVGNRGAHGMSDVWEARIAKPQRPTGRDRGR